MAKYLGGHEDPDPDEVRTPQPWILKFHETESIPDEVGRIYHKTKEIEFSGPMTIAHELAHRDLHEGVPGPLLRRAFELEAHVYAAAKGWRNELPLVFNYMIDDVGLDDARVDLKNVALYMHDNGKISRKEMMGVFREIDEIERSFKAHPMKFSHYADY